MTTPKTYPVILMILRFQIAHLGRENTWTSLVPIESHHSPNSQGRKAHQDTSLPQKGFPHLKQPNWRNPKPRDKTCYLSFFEGPFFSHVASWWTNMVGKSPCSIHLQRVHLPAMLVYQRVTKVIMAGHTTNSCLQRYHPSSYAEHEPHDSPATGSEWRRICLGPNWILPKHPLLQTSLRFAWESVIWNCSINYENKNLPQNHFPTETRPHSGPKEW